MTHVFSFIFIFIPIITLFNHRYCLWILGNATTLSRSGSIWADLVRDAKDRQCFFNANSDKDISRVLAKHKIETNKVKDRKSTPFKVRNSGVWVLTHITLYISPLSCGIKFYHLSHVHFPDWCIIIVCYVFLEIRYHDSTSCLVDRNTLQHFFCVTCPKGDGYTA